MYSGRLFWIKCKYFGWHPITICGDHMVNNLFIFACFDLNSTIQTNDNNLSERLSTETAFGQNFFEFSDEFRFIYVSDDLRKISIKIEFGLKKYPFKRVHQTHNEFGYRPDTFCPNSNLVKMDFFLLSSETNTNQISSKNSFFWFVRTPYPFL